MLKIKEIDKVAQMHTPFWYCDVDLFKRTVDEAVRQGEKYGIRIHYSIKANSEKRLLSYMREKGIGADCVSGNEVAYALDCGFSPETMVFLFSALSFLKIFNNV